MVSIHVYGLKLADNPTYRAQCAEFDYLPQSVQPHKPSSLATHIQVVFSLQNLNCRRFGFPLGCLQQARHLLPIPLEARSR